jgi:hypothetical protein
LKRYTIGIIEIPERQEISEEVFGVVFVENFLKLWTDNKSKIQEI